MEKETCELTVFVKVEIKGLPAYRIVSSLGAYFVQAFDEISDANGEWLEPGDDAQHCFKTLPEALTCLHDYIENQDFTD